MSNPWTNLFSSALSSVDSGGFGLHLGDHYGIKATLWVHLAPNSPRDSTSGGVDGWTISQASGPGRNAADYCLTAADFLQRTRNLLDETAMKHVVEIWVGKHSVFRSARGNVNTNTRNEEDNRAIAFAAGSSYKDDQNGVKAARVWAHGFGEQFETNVLFSFSGKHSSSNPPIILDMLALPIELSWKNDEELFERMSRLNQFLDNKKAIRGENDRTRGMVEDYLKAFHRLLLKSYGAVEAKYKFSVDLGSIVW